MGERAVGIVPVILCLHAPIAIVSQREGSVSEGTSGCPKHVYKFRTAANPGYKGLAAKSFTVRHSKSRRRHAAATDLSNSLRRKIGHEA